MYLLYMYIFLHRIHPSISQGKLLAELANLLPAKPKKPPAKPAKETCEYVGFHDPIYPPLTVHPKTGDVNKDKYGFFIPDVPVGSVFF